MGHTSGETRSIHKAKQTDSRPKRRMGKTTLELVWTYVRKQTCCIGQSMCFFLSLFYLLLKHKGSFEKEKTLISLMILQSLHNHLFLFSLFQCIWTVQSRGWNVLDTYFPPSTLAGFSVGPRLGCSFVHSKDRHDGKWRRLKWKVSHNLDSCIQHFLGYKTPSHPSTHLILPINSLKVSRARIIVSVLQPRKYSEKSNLFRVWKWGG